MIRIGRRFTSLFGSPVSKFSKFRASAKSTSSLNTRFTRFPEHKNSLYDARLEKDSCGVGLVAHLKKDASRQIVMDANEMLVRMSHRGGCGCEVNSGDGAGILVGMPDSYFRRVMQQDCNITLGPANSYGTGIIFIPHGPEASKAAMELFETQCKQRGLNVLGWRDVETDNSDLGATSKSTEPQMRQIFVENSKEQPYVEFDAELYRVRKLVEDGSQDVDVLGDSLYVCSLSSQTITYKGQLTPEQVLKYYKDLQQPDFASHMALVHSRFSTNTFPSWERAQPIRMMCHNGEINTLRGNKNWMYSRSALMSSEILGEENEEALLSSTSDNMSDSGNFDAVLDLLAKGSDRSLPECVMMMIPEAWQDNPSLSDTKRAFYEYNSNLMEPWDGPAMIAFTDGKYIGATLDRNGLRPSRYYVTKDDRILLSSEVGVVPDLPDELVRTKARLEPGKMFLVDFEKGDIVSDTDIKELVASSRPYGEWLKKSSFTIDDWKNKVKPKPAQFTYKETNRRLNMFGFTHETIDMLLYPMGVGGKEALGSMGNDAPLAVMSDKPRLVFDYFKQLFAQVTNPPIDPIREEMVMSLRCPVGPEANLLEASEEHCARMVIEHPILTLDQMYAVKNTSFRDYNTEVIDCTIPVGSGEEGLVEGLISICEEAAAAVQGGLDNPGKQIIILSQKLAGPDRIPIPSLLATGAVQQHLIKTKQRAKAALFLECGDAREVHDFATLVGFGADGICPYMAYETIHHMNDNGYINARSGMDFATDDIIHKYRNSAAKGLLKVMSKMGISTLQSYKGAQVFEAIGLEEEVMERCFAGTTSRIQGAGFAALYSDMARLHQSAYEADETPEVNNPGHFHYRDSGEAHLNTPQGMVALQQAARLNSREAFKMYTDHVNEMNKSVTLRGVLKLKTAEKNMRVPLEEVEPIESIVKRFNTGAMSLGSISQETHETLAMAMNSIKGRSNTGEGGEDPARFLDNRRSAIKQVASGRFGVTSHYLANSDQIQIKMAQGAKPGEGGELPGFKVSPYIASSRMTTPGVGLISPPPHHDIYSIEDLAQLIHDLKNAQPEGEVSVKLVSEVGVGIVAAGVAKAKADHITISGGDGGTGAAAWTGVKGCGLPWELGLAEAQQTLVVNDLRSRVKLQTDGQLKTGRDIIIASCLGAEEFGFATAPLIALGCIMMRKCHLNTCPVGVATQDPELRKKFSGKPEHVVNFFWLLAEEIRGYLAELGVRSLDELVGRADLLEVDESTLHYKNRGLDLSALLVTAGSLNEENTGIVKLQEQDHELEHALDNYLLEQAKPAFEDGVPVYIETDINNLNRTCGTILSYNISKKFGKEGLPDDLIHVKLNGHGGQSLGFALAKGVFMEVEGDSNDGTGKGLSGGKIAVYPKKEALDQGFNAQDNVIIGNVGLYGATSGKAFFRGKAGERFAVRNSGAVSVVEGVGDHGCEYMTGGRVVILGATGRNFAAGMSGGIAYIHDPHGEFPAKCNMGMVALEKVETGEEMDELKTFILEHQETTGSTVAAAVLDDWPSKVGEFVKVMPMDYKRVLEETKRASTEPEAQSEDGVKVSAN